MASIKLKDIVLSNNPLTQKQIKIMIDDGSIYNYKTWTIEKIISDVWFFIDENDRNKVKSIIFNRKGGEVKFKKYMDNYVKNLRSVNEVEMNTYINSGFFEFEKGMINCRTYEGDYLMTLHSRTYIRAAYLFYTNSRLLNPLKREKYDYDCAVYDLVPLLKTDKDSLSLFEILNKYYREISKMPPKSKDSNASKKGIVTEKTYKANLKKNMLDDLLSAQFKITNAKQLLKTYFQNI